MRSVSMEFGRTVSVVTEYLPDAVVLGVAAPPLSLCPFRYRSGNSAGRSLAWVNAGRFPSNE
jgi:hypothetical protein